MARRRITISELAIEAGIEVDEVLIALWEAGFEEVAGPGDVLTKGSANRARRALGLATRRELGSPEYWQDALALSEAELTSLLAENGVPNPFSGGRLAKKAINRLTAIARTREPTAPTLDESELPPESAVEPPPLVWTAIGHERECRYLSESEVEAIHFALVEDFGLAADPIDPPGVRSKNLLSSAVHRPLTSVDGFRKYPTVEMAAAALLHAIVHDHPFHNGNKRTALVSMLVFLDENGLILTCDEDTLFKRVLQLAQHALVRGPRAEIPDRETMAIAQWLRSCSRLVEKGDRPLPWRRLRRLLSAYGCEFEFPGGVGNRINISRQVTERSRFLGRARRRLLRTQTFYGDEGREIDKTMINKIRHDLQLDDEHGIDSKAFYESDAASASEFIIRYRKTLRRLARL